MHQTLYAEGNTHRKHAYLEHLDEGDTEVQVGCIAQPKRASKTGSDGYNSLDIGFRSHVAGLNIP